MVVRRLDVDIADFPLNKDVIDFIVQEKNNGRRIIIATASHEKPAKNMANQLNICDEVYATTIDHNLLSDNKAKKLVDEFGENGFDYIGDSSNDIKIWEKARFAYMVNPSQSTKRSVDSSKVKKIFINKPVKIKSIIKEIRVYQWVKNLLIVLPLLMAHQFNDMSLYLNALLAFFSFSFTASFVYVLNDLLDLSSDRRHPRKRNRPIAAGDLSVRSGLMILPLLLTLGLILGYLISIKFFVILLLYLLLTSAYSFILKKLYIVDIILLSSLYTIRLIAGAFAVNVEISPWLLAFSMFIFLSLAFVKRYTEIKVMIAENKAKTAGRGYLVTDESLLSSAGVGSGLMSVLVFLLYAQSPEVVELYQNPEFFYAIAPFLLYWLLRIWFLAHRDQMHDDPIVFTVKDRTSYIVGIIIFILVIGAML